jgi:hypothetical protein
VERKFTVLSEFVANRHSFYLEKMDVTLPNFAVLEEDSKVQKLTKAFAKKYPGLLELLHSKGNMEKADSVTNVPLEKQVLATLHRFIKEKNDVLNGLIEHHRKRILKTIEMTVQSEIKQLQKINAKSRIEELGGITKKNAPVEYKRISDKYVRRGVEENRKLLTIKNKKVDELNESSHLRRVDLNNKSEEILDWVTKLFSNV